MTSSVVEGSLTTTDVRDIAERFSSLHLDMYVTELRTRDKGPCRKEINDALWGTVSLSPIEVVLLDSPLIQRLRYIRQLGVVHWVYPGAIHTRFEHSLGVLHQVRHLVYALNVQSPGAPLIDASHEQILRLAALLHDVGHAAFSHVSELAVQSLPDGNVIGANFSREHRSEQRPLSEIFTYYVIRSGAMRGFFEAAMQQCSGSISLDASANKNLDLLITKVSDAVIGKKIDDQLPSLHEIISGPFDADKLDYFARDAQLAGTPSVLDISRLVQKITVRSFDLNELPGNIASRVTRRDGKYTLFGIKSSGVAVLDELHLARMLMYAKIYRHPKVVAIEQMFRAVILMLVRVVPLRRVVEFLYAYPDDTIILLSESALYEALNINSVDLDPTHKNQLHLAADTLKAIRERRLWVRAFQLQGRYLADPFEKTDDQKSGLTKFLEDMEHLQTRGNFIREKLIPEVQAILVVIGSRNSYDVSKLDASIMIHTMGPIPGGAEIGRAFLIPASGEPMPFREYLVNRAAWADAYHLDQPSGYIFAPPDIADAVYLAVEKLIRLNYKVRLPPSALEASKRNAAHIDGLKRRLDVAAYYRGTPIDIRPTPSRLMQGDVPGIVDKFAMLRAAFLEPSDDRLDGSNAMSHKDRIYAWLRQFENDDHIECALAILDKFKMLTREDTVTALRKFISTHESFRGGIVVALGDPRDSGAIQAYFSADLAGGDISECLTLDQAARNGDGRSIIFVDDFVGSGGQVTDLLAAAFGEERMRKDLGEQREPFEQGVRDYLRRSKVAFVFTAGWDIGIVATEEATKKIGLDATVFRHLDEKALPFAFDGCLSSIDEGVVASFKNRCREIGRALAANDATASGKTLSAQKLGERELGYGNRAMLLGTPFNIPTQSLTAVWGIGPVGDLNWAPLMIRRKKV